MSALPLHSLASLWDNGPHLALPALVATGALLALSRGDRAVDPPERHESRAATARAGSGAGAALLTSVLLGIGIAGFLDEAIFHQLLQWHNFYWDTDDRGRIVSDGLFHTVSTLLLLWGTFRLWRGPRPHPRALLGGILLGAGGFNAYDGIVQHVILHLHLVNEHACPSPFDGNNAIATCPRDIPYEVVWIAVGLAVCGAGLGLWRTRPRGGRAAGA